MDPARESIAKMINAAGSSQNLAFYLIIESYFFYSDYEVRQARQGLINAERPDLIRQAYRAGKRIEELNRFDPLPVTTRRQAPKERRTKIIRRFLSLT